MLFNSIEFIFIFLPITICFYYLLLGRGNFAIIFIIIASLFFYGWWNPKYLLLILGSIAFNFTTGRIIWAAQSRGKLILVVAICVNLAALGYFKYANFFIENINSLMGMSYATQKIILPVAISFFSFQQIAYLVDVYKKDADRCTILEYSFFTTFFPHLLAGPILNHRSVIPQARNIAKLKLEWENIAVGVSIFIIGLFKKVILSDIFSTYSDETFSNVISGHAITFFGAWLGVLAFALQIYFDFSAYSDMAYGLGRMYGITLPVNFYSPYKANSIIDFWRSWHISLSNFLRDYLYIPLGGSKKGVLRARLNLMITMILGGLWHGASWTFVAWGTLHGIYLFINHEWRRYRNGVEVSLIIGSIPKIISWLLTFTAIIVAWVFFRFDSMNDVGIMFRAMFGFNGIALPPRLHGLEYFLPDIFYFATPNNPVWLSTFSALGIASSLSIAFLVIFVLPNPYQYFQIPLVNKCDLFPGHQWNKFLPNNVTAVLFSIMAVISIIMIKAHAEFIYFQF